MATELQGSQIELLLREYNNGTFDEMTCEKTVFLNVTNDVTKESTKCGQFKGIQVADFKLNGEAVFNTSPTSSEVSYDQVLAWQIDRTKVDWIIRNRTATGVVAGDVIRMSGSGYFVNTQFDGSDGQVTKFTWEIEGVGTINDTES